MSDKGRWLLWCVYVLLWTTVLVLPGAPIDKLAPDISIIWKYFIAKTGHVAAYALWTILSGRPPVPARFRWLLVFVLMAHASGTELLQMLYVPGRFGHLVDVGFDHLGIMIGIALTWKWWIDPR